MSAPWTTVIFLVTRSSDCEAFHLQQLSPGHLGFISTAAAPTVTMLESVLPQSLCSRFSVFLIIPWGKAHYMDYIAEHIRSMQLESKFLESDMLVYLMLISRQQL